jgi:hypothetical protein
MVGRYTVLPGNKNCERSAVSTDYTVKPGIENCKKKEKKGGGHKQKRQYTVALEHKVGEGWTQLGHYTVSNYNE